MTNQKRFEEHALQGIASASNSNERERRLAHELLDARDALAKIRDLAWNWRPEKDGDYGVCARRVFDIAQIATLPE
jgi:hypothetical protein